MFNRQIGVYMDKPDSIWTKFLDPNYQDPYAQYKDQLSFVLENSIAKVTAELLADPQYENDVEKAKTMAICLLMEQMLAIQYEHCPQTQVAMTISLFADLPGTMDFKVDLFNKFQSSKKKPFWKFWKC